MVAKGEQGQSTPEVRFQHEDTALAYLDAAELALECAQSFSSQQYGRMIHPEFYEDSGLSPQELEQVTLFGQKVVENTLASVQDIEGKVPHYIKATGILKRAVLGYQGVEYTPPVDDEGQTNLQPLDGELPQTAAELRAVTENARSIIDREPYAGDRFAFIGLSIINLAQFLSREDVQTRVTCNPEYSAVFRHAEPIEQAAFLVGAQLVSEFIGAEGNVANTLVEALSYTGRPTDEQIAVINNAAVKFQLIKQLLNRDGMVADKLNTFCSSVITEALSRGAANTHLLAQEQPDVEELHSGNADAAELVSREAAIARAVKGIRRKAQNILVGVQKVPDVWAGMNDVGLSIFPEAESPIKDIIEKQETARRLAELAAAQASQQETTARNQAELTKLLQTYILPRSKVKGPDGKQISTLLVLGGDNKNLWEAALLGKPDAFSATGLLLALDGMLNERQNVEVFGGLFDAVQRENILRKLIAYDLPAETIGRPAAWIADNITHLRQSSVTLLRRIGDGLAAYQLAQRTSNDPTARPNRNVSVQTLHKIEALRSKAEQLDIRAFPPGRVDTDALVHDLRNTIGGSGANANRDIDELRLLVLDELANFLLERGYQEQHIQTFRLQPDSLRQRVPYYALVLQLTDRKIIVAENPEESNETFVFDERDREAATWEELIQLNKDDIKEFGGRGMRHDPESLDRHVKRVKREVTRRLLVYFLAQARA